ncbi:MAG: YdhR family protein [Phycisphaerales bacterium]|nr:YdhR family protein [Phycisphaerales bacterium]MCB9841112.1 YdhR family protein [Phycisphaeraceae bacterium]
MSGCSPTRGHAAAVRHVPEGAAILCVRAASGLPHDQAIAIAHEREPRFREVPGLIQKLYAQDPETGEFCGIYIFESQAAMAAIRESDLARSIPQAYQAQSMRVEGYDLLFTLHPGVRSGD